MPGICTQTARENSVGSQPYQHRNSDNNCLNLRRPQDVNDFRYTFIHKAVIIRKLLTREELYALWKRDLSQHDCIGFKASVKTISLSGCEKKLSTGRMRKISGTQAIEFH